MAVGNECWTGGGVWRLKCHPRDPTVVLAANMHAGFTILKADGGGATMMHRYPHQQTLGYGAGWCHEEMDGISVVGTASFYDRLLHIWSVAV